MTIPEVLHRMSIWHDRIVRVKKKQRNTDNVNDRIAFQAIIELYVDEQDKCAKTVIGLCGGYEKWKRQNWQYTAKARMLQGKDRWTTMNH